MKEYGITGIPSSDIAGGAVATAGSFRSAYLGADPTVFWLAVDIIKP